MNNYRNKIYKCAKYIAILLLVVLNIWGSHIVYTDKQEEITKWYYLISIMIGWCLTCIYVYKKKRFKLFCGILLLMPVILLLTTNHTDSSYTNLNIYKELRWSGETQLIKLIPFYAKCCKQTIQICIMTCIFLAVFGSLVSLLLTIDNCYMKPILEILLETIDTVPQLVILIIGIAIFHFWGARQDNYIVASNIEPLFTSILIGITFLPRYCYPISDKIQYINKQPFITSLKLLNIKNWIILLKHILYYNVRRYIMLYLSLIFALTIIAEAYLGYLFEIGFGQMGITSIMTIGKIVAVERRVFIFGSDIIISLIPILCICSLAFGITLISDWYSRNA